MMSQRSPWIVAPPTLIALAATLFSPMGPFRTEAENLLLLHEDVNQEYNTNLSSAEIFGLQPPAGDWEVKWPSNRKLLFCTGPGQ